MAKKKAKMGKSSKMLSPSPKWNKSGIKEVKFASSKEEDPSVRSLYFVLSGGRK